MALADNAALRSSGSNPPPGGLDLAANPNASAAPAAAPMATPEPKMGTRESALINLGMAIDLIEQSLPGLGSESPEGQKAVAALRNLSGILGPRKANVGELQPAEIMQMIQSLPKGMGPQAGPGAGATGPGAPPGIGQTTPPPTTITGGGAPQIPSPM